MLLSLLLVMAACIPRAQAQQLTRVEFAQVMGNVTKDMKADEVAKLLGKPDDIRTQFDPGGINTSHTTEIWGYGTSGHLTFATLGSIYMTGGRVQYITGGTGEPPDAAMFDEPALRKLLQLIDAPTGRDAHNPLFLIQAVNALQPLGKEKAIAALREYTRVEPPYTFEKDMQVFLILRLLFEVPPNPGYMPRMRVGGPQPSEPADSKLLPLFPLVLADDIPLNMVVGYMLFGAAEPVSNHLDYFQQNGSLRQHPLLPGNDPLSLLATLEKLPQWIYPTNVDKRIYAWYKGLLANQLLQLIDTVYHADMDERGRPMPHGYFDQRCWDKAVKDVAALHIKWDPAKNIYVFADGTALPVIKPPIYERQIWEIPQLGALAQLIIERQNKDTIRLILEHNEYEGIPVPASDIKVYRTGADGKPLAEFHTKISPGAPNGGRSNQSSQIEKLSAGESLHAEITIDGKTTKSAVFTP
jgi:hypothetical protein